MKNITRIVIYGLAIWALPFGIGMLLFSIQQSSPSLFDSLMSITFTSGTVYFSYKFLKPKIDNSHASLFYIGIAWVVICLAIDLPLFLLVFGVTASKYWSDIGINYLVIPVVLIVMGALAAHSAKVGDRNNDGIAE